jgi:hypothetical protein
MSSICGFNKQSTDFDKYLVRKIFHERLGIVQDDEFITHEPAHPGDIRAFADGQGAGPNLENLHFDMVGGLKSSWNRRLFELLSNQLSEECENEEIPGRSDLYRMDLIEERFKRLKTVWNTGVPQTNELGITESSADVEGRLEARKQDQLKRARQATRRQSVSDEGTRHFLKLIQMTSNRNTSAGRPLWNPSS